MRVCIKKGAMEAPVRITFGLLGLVFSVAALAGIYGFGYFDAKPEYQGAVIGYAGTCLLVALLALAAACDCFGQAFRPRRR